MKPMIASGLIRHAFVAPLAINIRAGAQNDPKIFPRQQIEKGDQVAAWIRVAMKYEWFADCGRTTTAFAA
jgi:hypothetical protein